MTGETESSKETMRKERRPAAVRMLGEDAGPRHHLGGCPLLSWVLGAAAVIGYRKGWRGGWVCDSLDHPVEARGWDADGGGLSREQAAGGEDAPGAPASALSEAEKGEGARGGEGDRRAEGRDCPQGRMLPTRLPLRKDPGVWAELGVKRPGP